MDSAAPHRTLKSPSRRQRAQGGTLWSHAVVVILFAGAGIAIGMLVLWAQLVSGGNDDHRTQLATALASQYATTLDGRVAMLRQQMTRLAEAPETRSLIGAGDLTALQAHARLLTPLIGFADRVELVRAGDAAVDLNAEVPISFAALNLIRRAESEPFAGPEGIRLEDGRTRFYAAQPILVGGAVRGVLFVALSADFLRLALDPAALPGKVTLQQTFAGASPVDLLHWGEAGDSNRPIRQSLSVPHWTLSFDPDPAALPDSLGTADLLPALAVMLSFMLGGVLFAFAALGRKVRQDSATLLEQVNHNGRRERGQRFRLTHFAELAQNLQPAARDTAPGAPAPAGTGRDPAAVPVPPGPKETVTEDGKARRDRPAEGERTPADDFLEVHSTGSARDNFGIEVSEEASPVDLGLILEPEIFRAYDIRGITTRNLTPDVVYWIGRAFAAEARDRDQLRVAVGRDGRHSSAALRDALARGLTEGGVDVLDIGEVPTPLLYYATYALDTGTGIMITGSHNPPDYNGLKMMMAGETLAEQRIQALRERILENRFSSGDGDLEQVDLTANYIEQILGDVVVAQSLKVVVDCGNGVAGAVAPQLLEALGCEVVPLYCDVDGDFPNHHPDPAEPQNLEDLITVVRAEQADLGLAFDGDGDRLGVVTASGKIIWPDRLLMLFAQDIVGRNPGADIIYDVKCSRHLNTLISDLGGRPIMWKTGHSHMKAKIRETGALLAGEFSGHICFGERWYGFDDALYSAARLLEILGAAQQGTDELFAQFPDTFSTPELKIQTTEAVKFEVMAELERNADFGDGTLTTIDGLRVDFSDGWGLIRSSNTSPVLTLRFEADSQDALERIQQDFETQLGAIDPNLRFR